MSEKLTAGERAQNVIYRYIVEPLTKHLSDANRLEREIKKEIAAAEQAAREDERVQIGERAHEAFLLHTNDDHSGCYWQILQHFARALGVEPTRECNGRLHEDFAHGAHCEECNSSGTLPLTLDELVQAYREKVVEE